MSHILVHAFNWDIKYPNPKMGMLELHITWPYITLNLLHKNQSLVKGPRAFHRMRSNKEQKSPTTIWYHRLEEFGSCMKKHKSGLSLSKTRKF